MLIHVDGTYITPSGDNTGTLGDLALFPQKIISKMPCRCSLWNGSNLSGRAALMETPTDTL